MSLPNKIKFVILLASISTCALSQDSDRAPIVNMMSKFDSSTFSVSFNIVARSKILIYKELKKALNCDEWFMDVVYVLEKFDEATQTVTALPCGKDIDPLIYPDGTLGAMIELNNSKTPDYNVSIVEGTFGIGKGKYRFKIRFYYFVHDQRRFAESKYLYFDFF
jgi:hypothetical protein